MIKTKSMVVEPGVAAAGRSRKRMRPAGRKRRHYLPAEERRKRILESRTPGEAKKLGRQIAGFDEAVWLRERFQVVVAANMAKFAQNAELREFLLQTGDRVLVEASPVDRIWGIGLAADHEDAARPARWPWIGTSANCPSA